MTRTLSLNVRVANEPSDATLEYVNRGSTVIAAAAAMIPPKGGNYKTEGPPRPP
jgi:hypothetical protein